MTQKIGDLKNSKVIDTNQMTLVSWGQTDKCFVDNY